MVLVKTGDSRSLNIKGLHTTQPVACYIASGYLHHPIGIIFLALHACCRHNLPGYHPGLS